MGICNEIFTFAERVHSFLYRVMHKSSFAGLCDICVLKPHCSLKCLIECALLSLSVILRACLLCPSVQSVECALTSFLDMTAIAIPDSLIRPV